MFCVVLGYSLSFCSPAENWLAPIVYDAPSKLGPGGPSQAVGRASEGLAYEFSFPLWPTFNEGMCSSEIESFCSSFGFAGFGVESPYYWPHQKDVEECSCYEDECGCGDYNGHGLILPRFLCFSGHQIVSSPQQMTQNFGDPCGFQVPFCHGDVMLPDEAFNLDLYLSQHDVYSDLIHGFSSLMRFVTRCFCNLTLSAMTIIVSS